MATVTMSFPGGAYLPGYDYNPSLGELIDLAAATLRGTSTATKVEYKLQNGFVLRLNGTGFAFDKDGYPTAGKLTGLQLFLGDGKTVLQAVTGLNLSMIDVYDTVGAFSYDDGFNAWAMNQWLMKGNDTINGSSGGDDIYGHAGNDVLKGNAGDDFIVGGAGKDTYDGGKGYDILSFDDTYYDPTALRGIVLDAKAGTVTDPWGNSETFVGFEEYRGSHFADKMTGSDSNEWFIGFGGRDVIDGKGGVDEVRYDRDYRKGGMAGVTVNLTSGEAIDGFGKKDTLLNIENVRGTSQDDTLIGSSVANRLRGLDGNDFLDGRGGADEMWGGRGNDTYVVDNAGDIVDENADSGDGIDTVRSSITFSLANTAVVFGKVENLTLTGSGAINGTGNGLNNVITGNTGNNSLNGGAGNDTLDGGAGNDKLTGGAGLDNFRFTTALGTGNVDTITDFVAADDTIQLSKAIFTALKTTGVLATAAFRANTTGLAGDSDDRIIYETDTGKLFYDADGIGGAAGIHFATLTTKPVLTNADFVVI